jgi:uncharacterized cupredoxin-like copper-binding protein
MTRFRIAILGVAALVGVLAWALPAAAHQSRSLPSSINVAAGSPSEFKFTLSAKSGKSGIVIFKVTNKGKLAHDFSIGGRKTPLINPGKSNTLRVTLKKGSFPYKCTVPGHAAAGMKGVFKVT